MQEKRTTIKGQVYTSLFNDILDGCFKMEDILTEKQLVERYAVSKSPVREALVELVNEHVLRSIPRLGYQIIPITEHDVTNATELRLNLELAAFRRVIPIFSKEMINQISALNANWWEQAAGETFFSIRDRWHHNALFHTTLASFAGNELIVEVIDRMIRLEFRAYAQMLQIPENREKFFVVTTEKPHLEIERALKHHDFEAAERMLISDIMTLKNSLPDYIRTTPYQL